MESGFGHYSEELAEDRLLVARETLELSVERQAVRQHVLGSSRRRQDEEVPLNIHASSWQ